MHCVARRRWCLFMAVLVSSLLIMACSAEDTKSAPSAAKSTRYLVSIIDEPETTDFQCTTIDYTIALNVFNRLVETTASSDGDVEITPSLAQSWEISKDGRTYTFHLREGVTFSNGSALTAQDVRYTFVRLLTHPNGCNQDILHEVLGAKELEEGKTDVLEGFRLIDDHQFSITLQQPFSAFLACLCMPGASILDEESTEAAGDSFGIDPAATIGTGSFVFDEWNKGKGLKLSANSTCWEGRPRFDGLDLRFVYDADTLSDMYKNGKIDIINADDMGDLSDYYLHGKEYKDQIHTAPHIGIDYIALNESVEPLNDVRVRKALQLALDRQTALDAVYSGTGHVENGIFPHGLLGFNPNLDPIPYDTDQAKALLAEAGLEKGFDLQVSIRATAPQWQRQLMDVVCSMWEKVGVRPTIKILDDEEFMDLRTSGKLACYMASWAADFDDPDNFIYTFFANKKNTTFRSLCYTNEEIMNRVRLARSITNEEARMQEYGDLERIIVQEDAAWIPLFSRERHFLVSNRVEDFTTSWNGWFETSYKYMSIRDE